MIASERPSPLLIHLCVFCVSHFAVPEAFRGSVSRMRRGAGKGKDEGSREGELA